MDARTLCLGALVMSDASGYEIRKQFEDGPFACFHDTSYGSIYPALNRLAEDGLVSCTVVEQDGKPDKKVYSITEAGRAAFRAALHQAPVPDRIRSESLFMMFYADLLDPAHRERVYAGYLDHYRAVLARLEAVERACAEPERAREFLGDAVDTVNICLADGAGQAPHRVFARRFGLTLYRTMVQFLEDNRDGLMAEMAREDEARRKGDVA